MVIDISFDIYSDANSGEPDSSNPTLCSCHKNLWTKTLPNRKLFELTDKNSGTYLYHKSGIGEYLVYKKGVIDFIKARNKRIKIGRKKRMPAANRVDG